MAEQKWFEGLRRQIKHRCGPGWGIDERHGGVCLTRRIAAGKRLYWWQCEPQRSNGRRSAVHQQNVTACR